MKKKLLICGATGFIGRNMAEYFAHQDRYEVYGTHWSGEPIDHPDIRMIRADLTHREDVAHIMRGMDIVIQAAATTSGAKDIVNKPYTHVTDNAIMNALIFRMAFDARVKHLLFFSCTTMYPSSDTPLREDDFDANAEMYPAYFGGAWTKVYNEKMCEFYSRFGTTRFTAIRHSNIYGPYDKYDLERSHVFGATMTKVEAAADGDRVVVWGDGSQGRDLLYITDLIDFVERVLERQTTPYELFNVGCGSITTVRDLVAKIIQHSGKTLTIEHDLNKPTVNTRVSLDTAKARHMMGWTPHTSLDDGIEKTLAWYRRHKPMGAVP